MKSSTNYNDAESLGLLREEFDKICLILNRKPNFTELSIYSVMWSEHCSYKNSILWLKKLPKKGSQMLVEAGEEISIAIRARPDPDEHRHVRLDVEWNQVSFSYRLE